MKSSDFLSNFLVLAGQCWAHQSCALWSNFVCQAEDQSLLNVDKAIHSGSTEVCWDNSGLVDVHLGWSMQELVNKIMTVNFMQILHHLTGVLERLCKWGLKCSALSYYQFCWLTIKCLYFNFIHDSCLSWSCF